MKKSVANKNPKRPIIFVGVGGVNTLMDFAFYTLLTMTLFKDGHNIALAGFISGTVALFFAFMTHSLITWRGSHISHRTFLKFFLFTGFGMWVIRPLLLTIFIHFTGLYQFVYNLLHDLHIPLSYNFVANTGAFCFMVLIVLLYNYLVYDRYVFTSKQSDRTEPENH